MARFELQQGEEVIERASVEADVDGVMRGARLILTERRVLLIPQPRESRWLPRGVAKLFAASSDVISHQIRRQDFASATVALTGELQVRSKGEGYGMTHFEVTTSGATEWAERLQLWASGSAKSDAKSD